MKREIDRYIIDLIIIFESLVIFTVYLFSAKIAMYFLGAVILLSYVLGVTLFFYTPLYFPINRKTLVFYIFTIISTILYSINFRDDIQDALIFISGVMLLYYFYMRGIDRRNMILLLFSSIILIFFVLFGSTTVEAYDDQGFLESVWGNANMAGIVITSILFPIFVGIFCVKDKFSKLFLILFSFLGFYLLLLTVNRGSIMSIIAFAVLLFFNRKYYRLKNSFRILFFLAPLIILLIFINFIVFQKDVLFFGQPITQRPDWPMLVASIIQHPFEAHKLPGGGLNMLIAGIIKFGIFSLFSYLLLLIYMKPKWKYYSKIQYSHIAYFAFLVIFIQQSFESTIINGAYGLYVYLYLLLGIANSNSAR